MRVIQREMKIQAGRVMYCALGRIVRSEASQRPTIRDETRRHADCCRQQYLACACRHAVFLCSFGSCSCSKTGVCRFCAKGAPWCRSGGV